MKRIQELIVVEGKNDTATLKQYFDCDTLETNGTDVTDYKIDLIRKAKEKRGVIIFTDPDSPGNRIRNQINRKVPGCKNAFVDKADAHTTKKVGVEHASREVLEEALSNLITYTDEPVEQITAQDFYELGLMGRADSAEIRERVGAALHIGAGTAKTMRIRMNCLGITKEELIEVLRL